MQIELFKTGSRKQIGIIKDRWQ